MLDIFDILGPVMIGPSSSHTAGAAKIGAMARTLLGAPPVRAAIHLYGSFAETGAGHGTDRALVGGLLGMKPDDPRLPDAFAEAEKAGLTYTIDEIKLRSRQYAKRQLTWLRRDPSIHWFYWKKTRILPDCLAFSTEILHTYGVS